MAMTPIAQRLSRYSLKTIKRANPESLKKIKDSFQKIAQDPAFHDLQATFDVVLPKFGKNERIRVTSDPVSGQKHESLKATFPRGRQKLETYAEDSFFTGHGFGKLLSAEARSEHVSPRFILDRRNRVTEKSCDRYKEVLESFGTEQNGATLDSLAGQSINVKVLRSAKLRVKQAAASNQSASSLKLGKRKKQSYEEFVNDGIKYAEVLAQRHPQISPKLVLKKNRLQNVVAKDGFQKYQQVSNVFAENQATIQRLKQMESVSFGITGAGRYKITTGQNRSYLLNQNQSSDYTHFLKNGLEFAKRAAVKNDNVSAGLMVKNRFGFNRKVSLAGLQKFDEATRIFSENQLRLTELQLAGVDLKLRHNGQLRITRQENGREVFSKVLHHQKDQSLAQFIEGGLTQAKWIADATLPKKSLMSHLAFKNKRALAHEQGRILAQAKAEEQARIQAELAER
jgi:hypothetical protein